WHFWYIRGYWREGRNWLHKGLAVPAIRTVPSHVRARALFGEAGLANYLGGLNKSANLALEAVTIVRQEIEQTRLSQTLIILRHTKLGQGEVERASVLIVEGRELFRVLGYNWGIGTLTAALGLIAEAQGDDVRASQSYQEAVLIYRESGDKIALSWMLYVI